MLASEHSGYDACCQTKRAQQAPQQWQTAKAEFGEAAEVSAGSGRTRRRIRSQVMYFVLFCICILKLSISKQIGYDG